MFTKSAETEEAFYKKGKIMADIRIKDLEKKTSVSSGDIMVTDGSDGTRASRSITLQKVLTCLGILR